MKNIMMKTITGVTIAVVAASAVEAAEVFPSRTVRIIASSAPGALTDLAARLVSQKMSEKLGQPVIVENRAGADTMLGSRYVKNAAPDGYTILATSDSIASQLATKVDPGYTLKDFVGIGPIVRSPWVMLIGPRQPDRSVADFVARAKAHSDQVSFASGGVGTTPYMAEQMFLQHAGLKLLHVPYKGIGACLPDVISGRVTMVFQTIGGTAAKVRGGQLRALAVTSTNRLAVLPGIPTMAEQGMPGFSSYVSFGLLAPAGTPKDVVKKLAEALQFAMASKEVRQRLEADGSESISATPEEYIKSLDHEVKKFSKLAAQLGLKKE